MPSLNPVNLTMNITVHTLVFLFDFSGLDSDVTLFVFLCLVMLGAQTHTWYVSTVPLSLMVHELPFWMLPFGAP